MTGDVGMRDTRVGGAEEQAEREEAEGMGV